MGQEHLHCFTAMATLGLLEQVCLKELESVCPQWSQIPPVYEEAPPSRAQLTGPLVTPDTSRPLAGHLAWEPRVLFWVEPAS